MRGFRAAEGISADVMRLGSVGVGLVRRVRGLRGARRGPCGMHFEAATKWSYHFQKRAPTPACSRSTSSVAALPSITTTTPPRPRSSSESRPLQQPDLGRADRLDSALLPPSTPRSYRRPRCFRAAVEDLHDLSATSIARSTRSSFTHARTAQQSGRSIGTGGCVDMRRHRARWCVVEGACSVRIAIDAPAAGAR